MQPTNPLLQNPNSVLTALSTLASQLAKNVPTPTIPTLDFQAPSVSDLDSKYKEFLDRAARDPDIINYYNQLLETAKGDTNIAKQFLEKDYQMGTRQTMDTLKGTLASLGLTFGKEQGNLQDTLNKRGIALTQGDNGNLDYAGGGQAGRELGDLNESQRLRQEAEQRSASQNVERLGLGREKGLTSAGQQLSQYATTLGREKQQDISNRANQYYGIYQNKQASDLARSQMDQANGIMGFSGGGDTELQKLQKMKATSGGLNPVQMTQYRALGGT